MSIKDKKELRSGIILKDDVTSNKSINMHLNTALPILQIQTELLEAKKYAELVTPVVDVSSYKNKISGVMPKDKESDPDVERYHLIAKVESVVTKSSVVIYYDELFKDYIIIPDISIMANNVKHDIVDVYGYLLGTVSKNGCMPYDKATKSVESITTNELEMSSKKTPIKLKHVMGNFNSLSTQDTKASSALEVLINDKVNHISKQNIPASIVVLETPSDLTENGELPIYNVLDTRINRYEVAYAGKEEPSAEHTIAFILNF